MSGLRSDKRPTWWLLYAMAILLIGGLALVETAVPSSGLRSCLEVPLGIVMFKLMAIWIRCNREAMDQEDVLASHRPWRRRTWR